MGPTSGSTTVPPTTTEANAMIRQPPDWAAARASGRRRTRAGGRAGAAGAGRGRDVGGERGQVGVGPRGQRLARPRAEFVPGQPAVHERVLQRLDHLLAVGVARPEPVTVRRSRVLRSCRHRHHPPLAMQESVARLLPGGHAAVPGDTQTGPAGWGSASSDSRCCVRNLPPSTACDHSDYPRVLSEPGLVGEESPNRVVLVVAQPPGDEIDLPFTGRARFTDQPPRPVPGRDRHRPRQRAPSAPPPEPPTGRPSTTTTWR